VYGSLACIVRFITLSKQSTFGVIRKTALIAAEVQWWHRWQNSRERRERKI